MYIHIHICVYISIVYVYICCAGLPPSCLIRLLLGNALLQARKSGALLLVEHLLRARLRFRYLCLDVCVCVCVCVYAAICALRLSSRLP